MSDEIVKGRVGYAPGYRGGPLAASARRDDVIVRVEPSEGWFVASIPSMPGAYSQGRTLASALCNLADALRELERAREDIERAKRPRHRARKRGAS